MNEGVIHIHTNTYLPSGEISVALMYTSIGELEKKSRHENWDRNEFATTQRNEVVKRSVHNSPNSNKTSRRKVQS